MSEITFSTLYQKFKQKFEYISGNNILWESIKYSELLSCFIKVIRLTGENKLKYYLLLKFKLIKHMAFEHFYKSISFSWRK